MNYLNKDYVYTHWFTENGEMLLNPDKPIDNENGILFACEYWFALDVMGLITNQDYQKFKDFLSSIGNDSRNISNYSHDNETAFIVACEVVGKGMEVTPFTKIWHPRDWCFYLYKWNKLFYPLTFFLVFFHAISCMRGDKIKPYWYERIMNKIKGIDYDVVNYGQRTDGIFLAILRTYSLKNTLAGQLSARVIHYILNKRWGSEYLGHIANIYFKNKDHPVRQAFNDFCWTKWWK